jgi:hypothetical protein
MQTAARETRSVRTRARASRQPLHADTAQQVRTPGPAPANSQPISARVLTLQGQAGNAAVSRLLRVQRYDAFEHATEGDKAKGSKTMSIGTSELPGGTRIGGVQVTSGEINALADLYGSPDDLYHADPLEVAHLLELIHRQQANPGSVQESEWDKATGGRYTQLNLRNSAHFGARDTSLIKPPGGAANTADNRSTFMRFYSEAIVDAQNAHHHIGIPNEQTMQDWLDRSTIAAGFAEHYITDAFSAGHLFNKDDFISVLKDNLTGQDMSKLFDQIAGQVLADSSSEALLAQYEPVEGIGFQKFGWGLLQWRPNFDRQFAFKALLENLYDDPDGRQAVYSALVKTVHDRLDFNDAGGGLKGVPVENDFDSWVMSGDKTLSTSPKTQQMIERAIEKERSLLEPYRMGPVEGGGYAPGSEQVLAFFPRPTKDTQKLVSQMVSEVTDPKRGLIGALVEVMVRELPSILDQLVARGKIRKA